MEEEQGGASKRKHEEKYRKKDPRSWENLSKSISTLTDPEKLSTLEAKYNELYNEFRKIFIANATLTRQCSGLQKDLDQKQSELAKSMIARARLENLCRELQKQNKQIKDENMMKLKEEEERRKEVSQKFADKLNDINAMMDENKDKSEKLREENMKMTAKFGELYRQFQKREEDITKMAHQMELERQYSQATLMKMELEIKAQKELYAKEQSVMKTNLEKSEANCKVLVDTVKGLEDHIDIYKAQYQDFENTMVQSNEVFDKFKFEMSNMKKQMAVLDKEAQSWRTKWQDSMRAVLELTELKRNQDLLISSSEKKIEQLQKLCRQLQVDRASFLKLLKDNNIEPITQIAKTEHDPSKEMTKKEKELELLKDNLQAIQNELTKISVDAEKTEETTTSEDLNKKPSLIANEQLKTEEQSKDAEKAQ